MHIIRNTLIVAVIVLCLLGIQILLSTRKSRYPGLIVPIACFGLALFFASLASNASSGFLAFLLGSIPWILNAALYVLCRVILARRTGKLQ